AGACRGPGSIIAGKLDRPKLRVGALFDSDGASHPGERSTPMQIAQVAPLFESVPPKLYGGTERVVSYLTEELVRQGHEVTLWASGDSETAARLVPACPRALWRDPACRDPLPHHVRLVELVASEAHRFDIIHFHLDYVHFPTVGRLPCPTVTTLHGR